VVKTGPDGTTVLNETAVTFQWMEANLPVLGDWTTHYFLQGPFFVDNPDPAKEMVLRWNPAEDTNVQEKDMGAVKGTSLADLAGLVGGLAPGNDVMVHAADGYHVEFGYPNLVAPDPRQGPVGICWYNAEETDLRERQGVGYPPDYHVGMRLVFFADTSTNPEGKHVFGNCDMRAADGPSSWSTVSFASGEAKEGYRPYLTFH
jgi:hypothetical protein